MVGLIQRLQGNNYVHLDVSSEAADRLRTGTRTQSRGERPSPSESATAFPVGTRRKGNDGRTWVVRATLAGVRRWAPPPPPPPPPQKKKSSGEGKAGEGKAMAAAAMRQVVVVPKADPVLPRTVALTLRLPVRHPFFTASRLAVHTHDADADDDDPGPDPDAFLLLDDEQRALLARGMLQSPHFHEDVRDSVRFALEAMRLPMLPAFDVRVSFAADAFAPSGRPRGLTCSLVVAHDATGEFKVPRFREKLQEVLERSNIGGGGYQGPMPALAKDAAQWRKQGRDIWKIKYVVMDDGKTCEAVPRSAWPRIGREKRLVTRTVAVRKRSFLEGLLGRHAPAVEEVQRKVTVEVYRGREVFTDWITVEMHVA